MAVSLTDLLKPKSADTLYAEMLAAVASAGVKVANWRTGGPYKTLLRSNAVITEVLYGLAAAFVSSGFLDTAEKGWLTLLAESFFSLTREAAKTTAGTVTLTCAAGSGPYTIPAGGLIVATSNGLRYRSTASVTVPASGSANVATLAESPGAKYNVGLLAIDRVISPTFVGLSVSNPGNAGEWITSAGADEEDDDRLKLRCKTKWATLGTGSPSAAYVNWALSANAEIYKVGVAPNLHNGTYAAQWVTVILYGDGAAVSNQAVTDAENLISAKMPNTAKLQVVKATTLAQTITAQVFIKNSYNTTANQAAVQTALDALRKRTPIGGTVWLSELISTIQDSVPGGIRNVTVTTPTGDIYLTYGQVVNFSYALTFTGVA